MGTLPGSGHSGMLVCHRRAGNRAALVLVHHSALQVALPPSCSYAQGCGHSGLGWHSSTPGCCPLGQCRDGRLVGSSRGVQGFVCCRVKPSRGCLACCLPRAAGFGGAAAALLSMAAARGTRTGVAAIIALGCSVRERPQCSLLDAHGHKDLCDGLSSQPGEAVRHLQGSGGLQRLC